MKKIILKGIEIFSVVVALAIATTFAASAQEMGSGLYAGASAGYSTYSAGACDYVKAGGWTVSINGSTDYQVVTGSGDTAMTTAVKVQNAQCDEASSNFRLFGGASVNEYFSVEVGYSNYGGASYSAKNSVELSHVASGNTYTGASEGNLKGDVSAQGMDIAVVGYYPVYDRLFISGRLGASFIGTELDASYSIEDVEMGDIVASSGAPAVNDAVVTAVNDLFAAEAANAKSDSSSLSLLYGIGAMYQFTDQLSANFEITRVDTDYEAALLGGNNVDFDSSITNVNFGAAYRF